MTILLPRVARTRWLSQYAPQLRRVLLPMTTESLPRAFSCSCHTREALKHIENESSNRDEPDNEKKTNSDPRINDLGRAIEDDFATIRKNYGILPNQTIRSL
jgi:triacylglycerol lipase